MSSSYYGEPNNMSGSSSSSSSSTTTTRKGKKSNSEKPKQPQRGLGVAQLEKIRLHGQIACNNDHHPNSFQNNNPYNNPTTTTNFTHQEDVRVQTPYYSSLPSSSFSYSCSSSSPSSYGYLPSITMGLGDYERSTIIYGDSQPTTTASWNPGAGIPESQQFIQPNMNRHILNLPTEDPQIKRIKKNRSNSMGSSSQNSESSDTQDVDLELRLSI